VHNQRETPPGDHQQMTDAEHNFYTLLGVPERATPEQIKRAYRAAMKRIHPDRVAPAQREAAENQAKLVNLAFRTLSNPQLRSQYDGQLKANAVQDQIMSRYFGGMGAPGSGNDLYEQIRQAKLTEDRAQRRQHDRSATASLLLVFGALLAGAVSAVVLWGVVSSILDRVS
jgi:DnaJ-class molecular chaperone